MSGQKIIEGLRQAIAGDLARVTIQGELWTKRTLPNMRCEDCDSGVYDEWAHCPFCGQPLIIAAQRRRILDLEAALTAATETARQLAIRLEAAEAERDARPAVRWEQLATEPNFRIYWGHVRLGEVLSSRDGEWWAMHKRHNGYDNLLGKFPTPEAAKEAVEAALRKVDEKEGA